MVELIIIDQEGDVVVIGIVLHGLESV